MGWMGLWVGLDGRERGGGRSEERGGEDGENCIVIKRGGGNWNEKEIF